MAITEKRNIRRVMTPGVGRPIVKSYPIAATQGIFMPGAPCFIEATSGTVKLADTTDGTGDAWHGFIIGISDKSVHATSWPLTAELTAAVKVDVELIDLDSIYEAYCTDTAADAAAPQTAVGDSYGLRVETTPAGMIGYTTVVLSEKTHVAVKVTDVLGNLDVGNTEFDLTTAPGAVQFKFLKANTELDR